MMIGQLAQIVAHVLALEQRVVGRRLPHRAFPHKHELLADLAQDIDVIGLLRMHAQEHQPLALTQRTEEIQHEADVPVLDRELRLIEEVNERPRAAGVLEHPRRSRLAKRAHLVRLMIVDCEAVALAEKGGVTREVAVDAVLKSVAASPVLGYRGPFILEGKMPAVPLADVTLQQKDMLLALELGRKLGSPVPLAAAANEMMNACRGLGIDHRDFVTAHEVYRRLGGQS